MNTVVRRRVHHTLVEQASRVHSKISQTLLRYISETLTVCLYTSRISSFARLVWELFEHTLNICIGFTFIHVYEKHRCPIGTAVFFTHFSNMQQI